MRYYKTSQPVPGKGDAWMYYECNDDNSVRRYLTFIPMTGEVDRVPDPFIKKLQRPEMLMPADREEFEIYWPTTHEDLLRERQDTQRKTERAQRQSQGKHFDPDMTIGEAMAIHPRVGEVFAAFHLGGCSSCGVSEYETVGQVCMGYGIDVDVLLEVLEGLLENDPQPEAASSEKAAVD